MLIENTLVQNRYLVKNLIGRGGMGAVYRAEDTRFNNRVIALKEMIYSDNSKLETAFGREANLLAQLQHPRLPRVSDYFNDNGRQYLVMEYVPGEDLETLLKRNAKPFPVSRVMSWADSLLDILQYLHMHNPPVIHRDIKPQNLKLNNEDKIILLDFGLAKDTHSPMSEMLHSRSLVGFTPNFAPLEQIRGDRTTIQTDLYAFSATIYHLLTNVAPVSSLNRIQAKIDETPDPLVAAHLINPEVPVKLSQLLTYGMTLKQESRPASAGEMRRVLGEIIEEQKRLQEMPTNQFNYNQQTGNVNQPAGNYNQPTGNYNQAAAGYNQSANNNYNQPTGSYGQAPVVDDTRQNISYIPQTQVYPVKSLSDVQPVNTNFTTPRKTDKRNTFILFGALIGILGVGIVATFFIGQWITAKNGTTISAPETKNPIQETKATEPTPEAPSSGSNTASVGNTVTETKPQPAAPKPVQPKKPEPKPEVVTKPAPKPKPQAPVTKDGGIFQ